MPIDNFNGQTFVAFIDISGFKELMKANKAISALDNFYSIGYHTLMVQEEPNTVDGMFFSDCGVLFCRKINTPDQEKLTNLLRIIRSINLQMLDNGYMLTTSIAYGDFLYRNKIEFPGIEKNAVYGNAYVKAFLDNENGSPKMIPGQCRLVIDGCPINEIDNNQYDNKHPLHMLRPTPKDRKHLKYYWNLRDADMIEKFEDTCEEANNAKFKLLLSALKG